MRTRSSSNPVGESSPNPTTLNPMHRNRRRLKQPFILEESPVDTMANQCTMDELLCAPTEGYAKAIVVPPILANHFELKHSLINMMTSNQFFGLEKDNLMITSVEKDERVEETLTDLELGEFTIKVQPPLVQNVKPPSQINYVEMESILNDSVDNDNLVDSNDNLSDTIPEMFTDEHTFDYSSPPLYDDFDNDLDEF
nr:hypothetical protein [Tanacetum cinerariifolium]